MKVSVSLSWSFSRQWVTVSQQQPNRSVRGAELSRDQTTSTPAARAELDIHGPARAAGARWWAPALPISSLCIQFPFPTFLHWHQLEFPQKCSWEWEKFVRCPIGWRPDWTLFSADSSSFPEAQRADFCAEAKPCQGGVFWKASAVVCNICSIYLFFYPFKKRRKVHTNCKAKHW